MKINTFKCLRIASEVNQMTAGELRVLAECFSEQTGVALSNYIIFDLQERDAMNIEVQEPVC